MRFLAITWVEPGRFLSMWAALGGEQAGGLVDVVDAVDQLAHRSPVTEPLQQWPSRSRYRSSADGPPRSAER